MGEKRLNKVTMSDITLEAAIVLENHFSPPPPHLVLHLKGSVGTTLTTMNGYFSYHHTSLSLKLFKAPPNISKLSHQHHHIVVPDISGILSALYCK